MHDVIVRQTNSFSKVVKKLHLNQKKELDKIIQEIMGNPNIGDNKKGDLAGVKIYKFRMINQLTLLAYQYDDQNEIITLLALGVHENFYRELKNTH